MKLSDIISFSCTPFAALPTLGRDMMGRDLHSEMPISLRHLGTSATCMARKGSKDIRLPPCSGWRQSSSIACHHRHVLIVYDLKRRRWSRDWQYVGPLVSAQTFQRVMVVTRLIDHSVTLYSHAQPSALPKACTGCLVPVKFVRLLCFLLAHYSEVRGQLYCAAEVLEWVRTRTSIPPWNCQQLTNSGPHA